MSAAGVPDPGRGPVEAGDLDGIAVDASGAGGLGAAPGEVGAGDGVPQPRLDAGQETGHDWASCARRARATARIRVLAVRWSLNEAA